MDDIVDDLADRNARGRNIAQHARGALRRYITAVTDARLDCRPIAGRALDDLLAGLLELETDMSRCEGELLG
jgi:hypothetical protein